MQKSILTAPPLLPRVAPPDKADALDANAVAALAAALSSPSEKDKNAPKSADVFAPPPYYPRGGESENH